MIRSLVSRTLLRRAFSSYQMAEAAVPAIKHILEHVPSPRPSASRACPLFVGIQGPQGIGKTTLTKNLVSWLSSEPYSLKTVVFSIDDLYYGHEALGEIAAAHPDNIFLQGRGLPGTHDVNLGSIVLERLKNINATNSFAQNDNQAVKIPSYDKSLHDGRGDRVPQDQWESIRGPIDVVILEGWCLGFYPISESALESRWERSREQREQTSSVSYKLEDIKILNENLKAYVRGWYSYLACFIKLNTVKPNDFERILLWRLEQEHTMKSQNGGRGMSDAQVQKFLDRYIPGYIYFGDGVKQGYIKDDGSTESPPWSKNGLEITLEEGRGAVETRPF